MLGRVKRFIRHKLDNENYPAIHEWYKARDERKSQAEYIRHQNMTYAEIEEYIGRGYEAVYGRALDWDNPKTFTEKIKVGMLYPSTPMKTRLADKYLVREWIRDKIGEQYLIPLLGVYDEFDEIDFNALPSSFVIKCNHDSGSVSVVKDKSTLDMQAMRSKYDSLMKRNYAWPAFEMQYRDIEPKIVAEKYIEQLDGGLLDYKVHCFNGKPEFIQVIGDRDLRKHIGFQRNYNFDWQSLGWISEDYPEFTRELSCPKCLDELFRCSEILCRDFDYVRIDFYVLEDSILFGEMTFSPAGGNYSYRRTWTEELDFRLGGLWPFDNSIRKKILASHTKP